MGGKADTSTEQQDSKAGDAGAKTILSRGAETACDCFYYDIAIRDVSSILCYCLSSSLNALGAFV